MFLIVRPAEWLGGTQLQIERHNLREVRHIKQSEDFTFVVDKLHDAASGMMLTLFEHFHDGAYVASLKTGFRFIRQQRHYSKILYSIHAIIPHFT